MASFYIPLTGLNSDSTALNTIANNLANMNTIGYKSQTVNFSDLFHQQLGSTGAGDPIQLGSGTQVASIVTNYSTGSPNTTGVATDVALQGNGFFVVSDGSAQFLTRAGNFKTDSSGNLITTGGLSVMGYPATNGVVDTKAPLSPINIPESQVEPPKATTSFGMTAILDSASPVGTSVPGAVQVYDSLGKQYNATVTYTKTGTNAWSYSVTLPDTLEAVPATVPAATTIPVMAVPALATSDTATAVLTTVPGTTIVSGVTGTQDLTGTQTSYAFGSFTDPITQATNVASIDPGTNLTITGPAAGGGTATIAAPVIASLLPQPVSVATYAAALTNALTAANITGVTVNVNANGDQLTIVGPATMTTTGTVKQDMAGTTNAYAFHPDGTVDPATNLTITGATAAGRRVTITAPTVAAGETVAQYATDLTKALSDAGIVNVTATVANNQLSIVGANLSLSGNVGQDLATSTINYDFGSAATVNPASNLTITGPAVGGGTATIIPPAIVAGESVTKYAADLNAALTAAGIKTGFGGVTVTASNGQLSIVGPATTVSTAGTATQDLTATRISYNFAMNGGKMATVDPSTNLTITGETVGGGTATTTAPKVLPGETLAQYAKAMNDAITAAGIAGVAVSSTGAGQLSIVGANISTSGSVVQEPVPSANATGSLSFDASGNLVGPTTDVSGISFAGLSDGAATMDMTWNLYGTGGKAVVSQVNQTSAVASQSQNGFASGAYSGFTIGSDGTVTATFLNGQKLDVGQLVLGSVANLQGLKAMGSGNYAATASSGTVTLGASGTSGLGTMEGGALEASNVNISAEFSNLIIAQRAFEANSKAVTTFDTVTQETINMIR